MISIPGCKGTTVFVYGWNEFYIYKQWKSAHGNHWKNQVKKYILHYSDSNKTMEATISGKTIVISGSDSMRLVFETK